MNQFKMDIDIDPTSPILSFRIAFSIFNRSATDIDLVLTLTSLKSTIQIWGVTLTSSGSHAIGLSATRLALLRHRLKMYSVLALSLLGPTAAFVQVLIARFPIRSRIVSYKPLSRMDNQPLCNVTASCTVHSNYSLHK